MELESRWSTSNGHNGGRAGGTKAEAGSSKRRVMRHILHRTDRATSMLLLWACSQTAGVTALVTACVCGGRWRVPSEPLRPNCISWRVCGPHIARCFPSHLPATSTASRVGWCSKHLLKRLGRSSWKQICLTFPVLYVGRAEVCPKGLVDGRSSLTLHHSNRLHRDHHTYIHRRDIGEPVSQEEGMRLWSLHPQLLDRKGLGG